MLLLQETEQYTDTSQRRKNEVLDLWSSSLKYFNDICIIVNHFPKNNHFELDCKARSLALSISNHIAKCSKSKNRNEMLSFLEEAIDSVYSTVSTLLIANKWNYLRKDLYHEIYHGGQILVKKIKQISLDICEL